MTHTRRRGRETTYDELGDDKLPTRCTGNKKCSVNENFEGWQAASSVMTCLDQAVPMRAADDPFEPGLVAI